MATRNSARQQLHLLPGFRFHPTDEELITEYLVRKIIDTSIIAEAVGEVDLNKCEPWDLPYKAPMGENQWYFFCMRDRKYPTGSRTNRATEAGYWKATGKDKEVYKITEMTNKDHETIKLAELVGMKKTLVFYKGRAPRGEKTNWVMHEYRLEGNCSSLNLPAGAPKDEWVICRVFQKSASGRRVPLPDSFVMDSPQIQNSNDPHVPCFSSFMENHDAGKGKKVIESAGNDDSSDDLFMNCFNTSPILASPPPLTSATSISRFSNLVSTENNINQTVENQYQLNSFLVNDPYLDPASSDKVLLRALLQDRQRKNWAQQQNLPMNIAQNQPMNIHLQQNTGFNSSMSSVNSEPLATQPMAYTNQDIPSSSAEPVVDPDYFWNCGI